MDVGYEGMDYVGNSNSIYDRDQTLNGHSTPSRNVMLTHSHKEKELLEETFT